MVSLNSTQNKAFTAHLEVTPVPQARVRGAPSGGSYYYPKASVAARDALAHMLYNEMVAQDLEMWEAGIPLEVTVTFGIPIKEPKKKWGMPSPRAPDIDNFIKMLLDAMQGEVFVNDGQVWKITAEKRYAPHPGYIDVMVAEHD